MEEDLRWECDRLGTRGGLEVVVGLLKPRKTVGQGCPSRRHVVGVATGLC